jgi:hypothetical protein
VSGTGELRRLEEILDASGVSEPIEMLLPIGVRPRQLTVRTLLIGMLLALSDKRPAHLMRLHQALICLSEADKRRIGVIAQWKTGPHELTYRQLERTFGLLVKALSAQHPDRKPCQTLSEIVDRLLEASVKVLGCPQSSSLAIDWSNYESFARPPRKDGRCADPEAAWGHRNTNHPGQSETFFGYYLQAATIVSEDGSGDVPELVRRITLSSCKHDPPAQIVPMLQRIAADGIHLGDLLADSGYSYRAPETFAAPMRSAGAALIMDLHPNDRGCKGTHQGAILCNGNLYCPATPKALFELCPPAPATTEQELQIHDQKTEELSRYKLGALSAHDQDGYHRAICPAAAGKIRCPHKPESMALSHKRPTILSPPENAPVCCTQKTITVPPSVSAKTAQKHDYPSQAHRHSYNRRSAAERSFSHLHDPASNDIKRGWCRLIGLTPNTLFLACAFIIANTRVTDAFTTRQAENERRAACGQPPRHRRKRQRTPHDPIGQANAPPAIAA